jgi:hypothetical protein
VIAPDAALLTKIADYLTQHVMSAEVAPTTICLSVYEVHEKAEACCLFARTAITLLTSRLATTVRRVPVNGGCQQNHLQSQSAQNPVSSLESLPIAAQQNQAIVQSGAKSALETTGFLISKPIETSYRFAGSREDRVPIQFTSLIQSIGERKRHRVFLAGT